MTNIPQGRIARQPANARDAVEMALFDAQFPPVRWAVLQWDSGTPTERSRHQSRADALAAARALLPLNVSIEDADLWDGQKADADAE
jgi:hypothetical protein